MNITKLLSKTLRLADGTELVLEGCFGGGEYFRDTMRDVLEFRLRADALTLDEADALFSAENCAALTVIDTYEAEVENEVEVTDEDGNVTKQTVTETTTHTEAFAYEGYTERVSLAKREEKVLLDDNTTETVELICCKMGEKAEVEELRELSDALLLEVLGV